MPKRKGSKTWLHPAETLLTGHILYPVKFLGECVVEKTKGTEVVKEAIRKMKFNKHIKRAEGQKPPKVELVISAQAVCILDKSRTLLHRYPLHLISYCADDKADKRMVTFIAKDPTAPRHFCYVFDSEKCAEEITLTIGQAFDLAYKKFLETSSNDNDLKKKFLQSQKRVQDLVEENTALKRRLAEVERLKDRSDIERYKVANQIHDLTKVEGIGEGDKSFTLSESPSRPAVGRRLENLFPSDSGHSPSNGAASARHTNGTHHHTTTSESAAVPILSPPPANTRATRSQSLRSGGPDLASPSNASRLGTSPLAASPGPVDPFGMQAFSPQSVQFNTDQELMDMQDGFSRGLTFGTDDFNLDDLDPLNQK